MASKLPDFSKPADLTFFSSTNTGSISAVLIVPNDVGLVNTGVTQPLYASIELTGNPIGQRITNDLGYTSSDGTKSYSERLVSFYFKDGNMQGDLSIISVRDVGFTSDPYVSINRIINGGGDFTFSQGYVIRLYYPIEEIYQFSVYFTN